jgi:hypothetical protein
LERPRASSPRHPSHPWRAQGCGEVERLRPLRRRRLAVWRMALVRLGWGAEIRLWSWWSGRPRWPRAARCRSADPGRAEPVRIPWAAATDAGGEQGANALNQTAPADTQRQQTPRSEPLSQHSSWSRDSRTCFHTAEAMPDSFRELCDANPGPVVEATTTPSSAASSGRPRPAARPRGRPGRVRRGVEG